MQTIEEIKEIDKNDLVMLYLMAQSEIEFNKKIIQSLRQEFIDYTIELDIRETKVLKIELEEWTHECGDKCCFTYGTDIFVNGEQIESADAPTVEQALSAVLIHLGYEVEIGYK